MGNPLNIKFFFYLVVLDLEELSDEEFLRCLRCVTRNLLFMTVNATYCTRRNVYVMLNYPPFY